MYNKLNAKYPGVFLLIKYEELVSEPVSLEIGYIGLGKSTGEWENFSRNALHSNSTTRTFGVKRKNGTANIDKWRKGLSLDYVKRVNALCKNVVDPLNYEFK